MGLASALESRFRRRMSRVSRSPEAGRRRRGSCSRPLRLRHTGTVAGAIFGLIVWLHASTANAYCRTTTCDVDNAEGGCTWDDNNCATSGESLYWPDSCGWFGVQKDGSAKRKISYDTLHSAVVNAFGKWSKADCGGGAVPSFALQDTDTLYGPIECATHEFNKHAANASTWMFKDDGWPYVGTTTTIALTTLSVDIKTGRILDADVEINSFGTNITTSDTNVGADLDSIVTHESGHFLGLAHSAVASSTMFPNYPGIAIRSLDPDDEEGICAVYPPSAPPVCSEPEPLYGFSRYCGGINPSSKPDPAAASGGSKGCAVGPASPSGAASALTALALAGALAARRRRSR